MSPIQNSSASRRSSGRFGRWLVLLLLLIIAGCGLWTWATLNWAYAEGERAGILQRFVRRGWVCKTSEGEIALYYGGSQYMGPGTSPQLWDFSVRDATVQAALSAAVGHRVQLHYTEHPGIPTSCFAETRFLVDRVTIADEAAKSPDGGPQSAMKATSQSSVGTDAGGLPQPSPPASTPSTPPPTSP